MSKIKITKLEKPQSELNLLSDRDTGEIVGGRNYRKQFRNNIKISTIVQLNNNINIQLAFNGDNYNLANLNNNAGSSQG